MKKKIPISKLKKKAWSCFSLWVRNRGAKDGKNTCVTCGKVDLIQNLHASHFIPGRRNSILFLEENCHPACMACNIWRHGALENYYPFMLKIYGQDTIDRIKRLKNELVKFTRQDLEAIIVKYKL